MKNKVRIISFSATPLPIYPMLNFLLPTLRISSLIPTLSKRINSWEYAAHGDPCPFPLLPQNLLSL
jgi:hypothetical protein